MSVFLDPATIKTIITGSSLLYDNRRYFISTLRRVRNWLRKGHTTILVFGAGATGKTTLGQFIAGKSSPYTRVPQYSESLDKEEYEVPLDSLCNLIIPPGQWETSQTIWDSMCHKLSDNKTKGLVHVVCSGFHTPRGVEMTEEDFQNTHIPRMLQKEMDSLNKIRPFIEAANHPITMITLITKQDLWWGKRDAVSSHYEEGEYNNVIEGIGRVKGKQHFNHYFLSTALSINNLIVANNVLAKTAEGYDQNIQVAHLAFLLNHIDLIASRK